MTDAEAHDLVALYVVDALSDEQVLDFEDHLAGCDECRREVAEMRSITALLSGSVDADPPAALRASVLSRLADITQEPQDPELRDEQSQPSTTTTPLSPSASPPGLVTTPDNVIPLRPRLGQRLAYLVAAAAVLLALGFGGWALQSRNDAHQASDQTAQLVSLLGASDVRTVSSDASGGGSGTVVLSDAQQQAVFVSSGMPALPDDKTYELWTITAKPAPAGTFTVSGDGKVVDLPAAALSAAQIAVTVEPAGGSDQPTSTPILAVTVP